MEQKKITPSLLRWFHRNKRDLPWRKTKDPYRIWVSEVMLQQTQVETVIPYYHRWLSAFPTIKALAGASLSEVLKLWEGLGYYARARNLHRAAKMIVKNHGRKFPDSAEALRRLPGIGRYTAGAIASIAFNEPEPILDGNVKRVLSRLGAMREPIDSSEGERKLWQWARTLVEVEPSKAGDFNQSLMELGALICLAERPKCSICPVWRFCEAHRLKKEEDFPVKSRREKVERLRTVAAVVRRRGRLLLEKQPLHGRWGGLWTFPHWVHKNGADESEFLKNRLRRELGIRVTRLRPKMTVEHGFTKYRVRLEVYEGRVSSLRARQSSAAGEAISVAWRLLRRPCCLRRRQQGLLAMTIFESASDLSHLPIPRPHQKIVQALFPCSAGLSWRSKTNQNRDA